MGYPFYVNEHVLIPRQDTETLAEEAVRVIRAKVSGTEADGFLSCAENMRTCRYQKDAENMRKRKIRVLDMCTGSGCILLSILRMCPQAEGTGCDISEDALAVAGKNARRLKADVRLIRSDLFDRWMRSDEEGETEETLCGGAPAVSGMRYDVIVSNPPYIPTEDIEGLEEEVRLHDPRIALDGGEDGLIFYRRIVKDSISHIEDGGYLLFEIGCDQGKDVAELMKSHGYQDVKIKKDLSGLDRVVMGRYNRGSVCGSGFL